MYTRCGGHLDLGQADLYLTVNSICSKMLSGTSMAGLTARGPAGRVGSPSVRGILAPTVRLCTLRVAFSAPQLEQQLEGPSPGPLGVLGSPVP